MRFGREGETAEPASVNEIFEESDDGPMRPKERVYFREREKERGFSVSFDERERERTRASRQVRESLGGAWVGGA